MLDDGLIYHDKEALLYRLHAALEGSDKDVVFVVGAPVTAPFGGQPGVADVDAVVQLIRSEFARQPSQLERLDRELSDSLNRYQSAFDFLSGRAGQDVANRIIKRAVAQALLPAGENEWRDAIARLSEDQLRSLDQDCGIWSLSPAVSALGGLVAKHPQRFGKIVLTSNFDPLVEASIKRSEGTAWRTALSVDGSIFQSDAQGCQVIHIHGYWHGSDTLHTSRQLVQQRPTLKNDLLTLLKDKVVVVIAYGGWPDIFTGALSGVVSNDNLFPQILWAFFDERPSLNEHLYNSLKPGIDRNRVTFYRGINCHEFLPELFQLWEETPLTIEGDPLDQPSTDSPTRRARATAKLFRLAPLECDRPPNVEVWVGRENELRALETSAAKVAIICGIGGEGKSALASRYIATLGEQESRYQCWDWRDCKEQSDRIRTQIIEIIVRFSDGAIVSEDLADADDSELIEVLIDQTSRSHAVLVFDNVDSYVDLENRTFIGLLDKLIQKLGTSDSTSRVVLTCRPEVQYTSSSITTIPMSGISDREAVELFQKRAPDQAIPEDDVRDAHSQTKGHAFWLDLLAVQVTKVPGTTLRKLLNDMRRGRDDVPDVLSPLWDKLAPRERILLRFMAEAVRPETEATIERFVASQLNYQKFSRALKSLITLNLVVVKPEIDAPDLYDLHPLVRQFVRTRYERSERSGFIRVVINQYEVIIGTIEALLGIHMPYAMLERWSQKAELQVSAGFYEDAFDTLIKVEDALIGGGHVQEYVRVGRLLFESIDWEMAPTKYKEFDKVVATMVSALNQLGDADSADSLLLRYEATIPQKTARYISFCDVRAYSYWMRGEFDLSVEWAAKGVTLKTDSKVDTNFDCQHTLALAQRDAGQPETALKYFLKEWEVADLTSEAEGVPPDGPMYGNVGRCLQLLGRMEEALDCYRRSMKILETDASSHSKSNRAYARRWVGQVFAQLGDAPKAEAFFMDAIRVLGASAPVRVRELISEVAQLRGGDALIMSDAKVTRVVGNWMRE